MYANPPVTVGVIIVDWENRLEQPVLLADKPNGLEIIGGFLEEGETLEQAIRREAMEEIGCELQNLEYMSSYVGQYSDGRTILSVVFLATIDQQPQPSEEVPKVCWVHTPPPRMTYECDRQAVVDFFNL